MTGRPDDPAGGDPTFRPASDPPSLRSPVVVDAPAKLTLSLKIVDRRADGMHVIDAVMTELAWGDTIRLDVAPTTSVRLVDELGRPFGFEDTLITRALEMIGVTAAVTVTKRIPPGAGLGGGSSDAAAILRWGGWPTTAAGLAAAAGLGADVAFSLVGGRARVRGIGELVEPLEPAVEEVTLLTPALQCSTPEVYAQWDRMGGPSGENGNDLEPAALARYPEIAEARDLLAYASGRRPRLAGSGSTWFVPGRADCVGSTIVRTSG